MSKQVDERVVSMQFDNAHFEKNVSTTMSTLDKLKHALKLDGASKGLEDINTAAGKVNMSGLGGAVESVKAKFSALDVVAVTALANITNSAVNAGKRMVSALTVEPISDGFKEYELTLNAVQTTMAGTGKTAEEVEKELKKLDEYADKTVYSTSDMLNNLPKFTNAGVELETATTAMIGIANATALAGGDAGKASIAFYNLGQAIGTGYLTRMDYNSINNAGIATMEWKEAMVEAAIAQGTLTKVGKDSYKAGNKTLTLQQLFIDGLQEQWATTDVMLKVFGDYGNETTEIGKKAYSAAQDVKTFTMMMESLKATAGTGWKDTWQLIFGGLDEAKEFWTGLNNVISKIIERMADFRNGILEGALGKSFKTLMKPLDGLKKTINTISDPIKTVTRTLEDYNNVVDEVIRGEWGHVQKRWDALTDAGYDWITVQNMVNEKLGVSKRRQTDFVIGQETMVKSTENSTEANAEYIAKLAEMSEAELEALGLTKEQIAAIKEIRIQADKLGLSVEDFIKNIDEIDGRWVLINIFKNAWKGLVKVFESVKTAWQSVFPPKSMEERSQQLYDIIAAIHKFSTKLIMSKETGEKLTRTFKGLFAVLDLVRTVLGGGFKIAFTVLSKILGAFHLDILDVTADIGDALVAFRDWLFENNALAESINGLIDRLPELIAKIKDWFAAFKETPAVQKLVDAINAIGDAFSKLTSGEIDLNEFARSLGTNLAKALTSLPEIAIQIGKDFVAGFQNGIEFSISDVVNKIVDFCLNFVSAFAEALGVQSPSWKAYETATDFFQGFINGAEDEVGSILDILKKIGEQIAKVFGSLWDHITDENGDIEWGKLFAGGSIVSMIWVLKQLADAFSGIAGAFDGIGDLLSGAGKALRSFSKVLNGIAWDLKAKALMKMAIAIGILVAAVLAITLLVDDPAKLWNAVGIILALGAVLVGLSIAMDKLSSASVDLDAKSKKLNIKGIQNSIIQIGLAILLIAAAVKLIGGMDPDEAKQGFIGLAGIAVGMVVFLAAMGGISRYSGEHISGIGSMMKKLAVAMILMVVVCKLAGTLDANEMLKGAAFAAGFAIFVMAITAVAKNAGEHVSKVGGMVLKLTIAMALMVGVCKLASLLSVEEMLKGAAFAAGFVIFVGALVAVTKIVEEKELAKVSGLVLSMSLSLLMMVAVCKLVGMLSVEEMLKGAAFVAGFVVLIKVLVSILKIGNEQQMAKVAGTILAMSAAIAILAGVAVLLSFMDLGGLAKGIIAVGLLSAMMTVMIKALKGAQNVKGAIMMMAITIAVMAASIAALSFIDTQSLISAAGAMTIVMSAFALMIKSMKGIKDVKVGPLIALTGVVLVLAGIIYIIQGIDPNSAIGSAIALSALMLAMTGVLKIISNMSIDGKNALKGVGLLLAMVVPLLAFSIVLRQMNGIDNAIKNVSALAILATVCSLLLIPLVFIGGAGIGMALKGVLALTAMALPLLAFVGVLVLMNNVKNATTNVMALTALATACTLLLIPLTIIGAIATTGVGAIAIIAGVLALTAMAVPMLAFVGVLAIMSGVENATTNAGLLIDLMTTMADLLVKISLVAPFAVVGVAAMTGLTLLIGAIGVMAVAIGALMDKFPSLEKFLNKGLPVLEQLAGSIGTMIGKFIGNIGEALGDSLVKIGDDIAQFMDKLATASDNASGIKSDAFDGVEKLMGIMLEIGGTSIGTGLMDGISRLFNFGDDSMETFEKNGVEFFNAMKAIGEASSKVDINKESVDAILNVVERLADLQSSLQPIGGVITWFTGRDDLGTFGTNAAAFVISMKTAFGSLNDTKFNTQAMDSIISTATSLAKLQSHLEPIGGVITWFTGRDDLGTFGINAASFIYSMKMAFAQLDRAELNTEAMNSIISAATSLARLQSSLEPIGGVITWFTGRDDLGTFGYNVASFIYSMKMAFAQLDRVELNIEAMNSIISASTKLAELQSHLEPIGGVITWFTGRDDLGTFGTNAAAFIYSMKTAMTSLNGTTLNEEAMSSVITAATKLAELQSSLEPMGGVVSWFSGRTDLGTFGINIGLFAAAMGKLKTGMGENGITEAVITSITNTGTALIELQKALPEEHWFDGKMNLSEFSDYVTDFATAMSTFSTKATEIDSGAVSTVINTAYRIKSLITSLVDLDTSGVEAFTGIGTGGFGADGPAYDIAKAIAKFSDKVADIDTEAVTVAVTAARKLKSLIAGLVGLDTSGIENFKPVEIGKQMKSYADKVDGIDTGVVSSSITSANRLKNFIAGLAGLDTSGITNFKPGSIGTALNTYGKAVSGTNLGAVSSSITAANRLKSFISSLAGLNTSGVGSFKTAITQLSTVNIAGLVKAFSGASAKLQTAGADMINGLIKGMQSKLPAVSVASTKIITSTNKAITSKASAFAIAGGNLATKLAKGISSKKGAVNSAVSSCLSSATSKIRDKYNSFYSAGSYLVTGFANGISANSFRAAAKAKAMANAAEKAARDALNINSPSKVFKEIGSGVPEGFAMGIGMLGGEVKRSVGNMASTAINTTRSAMSTVLDALNTDMDAQPTIRPVIDLSDVKTGVNAIGGMFAGTQSIGVQSNLSAINFAMNRKLQNGTNDDIISAINKLNDGLEGNRGDTYHFAGITYDNGNEISDAVQTLVRAAKMGRRV